MLSFLDLRYDFLPPFGHIMLILPYNFVQSLVIIYTDTVHSSNFLNSRFLILLFALYLNDKMNRRSQNIQFLHHCLPMEQEGMELVHGSAVLYLAPISPTS